jgi:hypothetical protein
MRMTARAAIIAVLAYAGFMCQYAMAASMTNEDVIKLTRAGLAEALILSSIDSSEPRFDTSADALIKLKKEGVSDQIIKRMIEGKEGPAAPRAGSGKGQPCKLATSAEFQAIMDGPKQVNLTYREADIDVDVSAASTIASFFTLGIAPEKGTVAARISGNRAAARISAKTPVFPDLATGEGQAPEDTFALVKFTVKEGDRILVMGEMSASLFGGYNSRAKFPEGMHIPLKLENVQSGCTHSGTTANVYRGIPVTPLQPGEYALLYGEKFFDFGVDP